MSKLHHTKYKENYKKYILGTIETGINVKVPFFINTGDKIVVNTDTGEYVERFKE